MFLLRFIFVLLLVHSRLVMAENTLKSVQMIFRHGKMSLDDGYGIRTGLLNEIGKGETFKLGQFVRKTYGDFIKVEYNSTEIEIVSSAANRCVQSGSLFAYGLYEEYNLNANWSGRRGIEYDPIPVQTIPPEIDKYLQLTYNCPLRIALKSEITAEVVSKTVQKYPAYINALMESTGIDPFSDKFASPDDKLFRIFKFIDPSVTPEEWAKPFIAQNISDGIKYLNAEALYSTPELLSLEGGPLAELLLRRMNLDEGIKKFYAYSSHDFSLSSLTALLGIDFRSLPADPPTTSSYFLELHRLGDKDPLFLKVFYKSGDSETRNEITNIPGCPGMCYVTDFYDMVKHFIPEDYDYSCQLKTRNDRILLQNNAAGGESLESTNRSLVGILSLFGFISLSASIVAGIFWKLTRNNNYSNI